MAGVKLSIQPEGLGTVRTQINRLIQQGENLQPLFADIGEQLINIHQQRFFDQESPDGEPWAPLSPTTRELKPGSTKDTILRLQYHLGRDLVYQASSNELEFGTGYEYGAMHHFGGVTSPKSMIPNKVIPARPWLGVGPKDIVQIYDIVGDFLQHG